MTGDGDGGRLDRSGSGYALGALGISTLFVLTVIAAAWLLYAKRTPIDFVSFWAAGRLALEGHPALAYDLTAHRAVEMTVANMRGLMGFPYPPPFLFAVVLFALAPFWLGYLLWMAATAGLYLLATRRFVAARFAFAHPAALVNAAIGQNGFLTASIFLFGLAALAASPFAGGAIFGLLVFKPQLGLLIPVALVAARQWSAIAGAALSSLALLAAGALVFGIDSYAAFLATGRDYAAFMGADRWNWAEQASVFGFLRWFGVPHAVALVGQGVTAIAAATVTWRAWSSNSEQRGAILAAATLLVPPYLFTYDSLLLILPLGLLLRDSAHPWRPALVWLLLAVPLLGYVGLYAGPNTVAIAAALSLWWVAAEAKKKTAAP